MGDVLLGFAFPSDLGNDNTSVSSGSCYGKGIGLVKVKDVKNEWKNE